MKVLELGRETRGRGQAPGYYAGNRYPNGTVRFAFTEEFVGQYGSRLSKSGSKLSLPGVDHQYDITRWRTIRHPLHAIDAYGTDDKNKEGALQDSRPWVGVEGQSHQLGKRSPRKKSSARQMNMCTGSTTTWGSENPAPVARRNTRSAFSSLLPRRNTFWSFPTGWCRHPPKFSKGSDEAGVLLPLVAQAVLPSDPPS